MPVMRREEWLRLTPRERLAHRLQRTIDRLESLQARYKVRKSYDRQWVRFEFGKPTTQAYKVSISFCY